MMLYIAGPMTNLPEKNIPAFNQADLDLTNAGYITMNPAKLEDEDYHPWEWYMRRALQLMLAADGVALLPGWENSRGAKIEVEVARWVKMPVKVLDHWLHPELIRYHAPDCPYAPNTLYIFCTHCPSGGVQR